mmetsp:Transcript_48275/g.121540  ORF Transcript_48275/g.121540 Transcript_48275/m.121540 type:complete len:315 (-) Transcript_48275:64-1008(-)
MAEEARKKRKTKKRREGGSRSQSQENTDDTSLAGWLESLGLGQLTPDFEKQNIDLTTLRDLDDHHLRELGITIGHRIRILKAIRQDSDEAPSPEAAADPGHTSFPPPLPSHHLELVYKVIVVGDLGTGKTSLVSRYVKGTFIRGYRATIGVDFILKEIQWNENTTVKLQLWDIGGQERFTNMTKNYYREATCALVVFDVTREKTFEGLKRWKNDIDSKVTLPDGSPLPCILLANKCDLPKGEFFQSDEWMTAFSQEFGFVGWYETSALEGIGIDRAVHHLIRAALETDTRVKKEYVDTAAIKLSDCNSSSGCAC